ncbi:hypothetical protein [Methanotorris formicicus]|uniref:Uncharacterized protein n=1 Tax=Methanotorris formicicus Mc-S-70 TaxID=647171 RepID=H1KZH4_9EURY|nr:hypothetical protein [Methanotorris formicicus]EHP85982.1 hypothetical protein MetfoDRAFT_1197 [Methanotorris formicicus Mc-S-70]
MGSANAFIMVGGPDFLHNGIYPTHCLILHENDKPWWVLTPIFRLPNECKLKNCEIITWIPTVEGMLEDALLMIGIYVVKDEELVTLANKFFKNKEKNKIWLYDDIEKENLKKLREVSKKVLSKYNLKIVVAITLDSTILRQIDILKDYNIECEVCTTRLARWEKNMDFEECDIIKRTKSRK